MCCQVLAVMDSTRLKHDCIESTRTSRQFFNKVSVLEQAGVADWTLYVV
jgi:hypothetical protein